MQIIDLKISSLSNIGNKFGIKKSIFFVIHVGNGR